MFVAVAMAGGRRGAGGGEGGLVGLVEGFVPGIAQFADALEEFLEDGSVLVDVGFLEAGVEVVVEAGEAVAEFAGFLEVEAAVEFADDGLGLGDVGGANSPLAIAVIGGTGMATLLTLYIVPVIYLIELKAYALYHYS